MAGDSEFDRRVEIGARAIKQSMSSSIYSTKPNETWEQTSEYSRGVIRGHVAAVLRAVDEHDRGGR